MKSRSVVLSFALASGLSLLGASAGPAKVVLCHVPPGNPGNAHTIVVGQNAVSAHLANHPGDALGECSSGCSSDSQCDDSNLCTSDACASGSCTHTPVSCEDGNGCTDDVCNPATGCELQPRTGEACDDGDLCTTSDACTGGGQCAGTAVASCCRLDDDCSDGDACTGDRCDAATGECSHESVACEAPACFVGFCDPLSGDCGVAPLSCDDGNACTLDHCDATTGECEHDPPAAHEILCDVDDPSPDCTCYDGLDNDCDGTADGGDVPGYPPDSEDCILPG